ncbi:5'-methylthioadenosine/S-adenosylhomocysteine nucleosidase family protein [Aspergillus undulatus]|uniref:5'-methylthioadenosine/S-adenosylhomocysteine nucleosidase family protein n=1 Tax=Aspergillus undulatus TaxID=1810928 RepID=UPI003CCD7403
MGCNARQPDVTLRDLLDRRRNKQSSQSVKSLLKEDKLNLAVAIARSLLYLLGSPLLDDTWEAERIYIEQLVDDSYGRNSLSCNMPYVRHILTGGHDKNLPKYPENRRSIILKLGVLLWEILFGHRISIADEDAEDDDEENGDFSLFNALNREEINARETFVEKPFLDIIASCLDVYSQDELDDFAFRNDVYWKIVKPLQEYQKAYQPDLPISISGTEQDKRWPLPLSTNQPETGLTMLSSRRPSTPPRKRSSSPCYPRGKRPMYNHVSSSTDKIFIPSMSPAIQPTSRQQSPASQPTLGQYNVGILCALPKELLPIRMLFDSTYRDPGVPPQDKNSYSFGRMGNHTVVATCLPSGQYGSNSAAHVISHMMRSFPALKFCLLVGIGAGIPTLENDIRLGDVVVSHPRGVYSGVIQHDLLKILDNKGSQLTGFLRGPPSCLLRDISNLMSNPDLSSAPLEESIRHIVDRRDEYKYPGPEHDRLFKAEYIHDSNRSTCEHCSGHEVVREPRAGTHPHIHYGLIASGNQVIKSAQARDELGSKYNVICFEMEAAGVMNAFDCLVIRGVSDYADSHKNDLWQNYASAAAAAYAKLLLTVRNSV